jgi:predicted DCC family thiol-disulfide oxidoreductase YuxK
MVVRNVPDWLILFDGVGVFCSWWVRFVIERDASAKLRFTAVQSAYGQPLAARLGIDPEHPETNSVIVGGHAYFKSDAAIRMLSHLPRWSWVTVFELVPRRVRDWLYDRVARRRYRLFGKTETCLVPASDIAFRFISDVGPSG